MEPITRARAELQDAITAKREADGAFEERTQHLAVAGRAARTAAICAAAVARAERTLAEARAAAAGDAFDPPSPASPPSSGPPLAIGRVQAAERRLQRERRALAAAQQFEDLAAKAAESAARLSAAQRSFDDASKEVRRIERMLLEARRLPEAPISLLVAVRPRHGIEEAQTLAGMEAFVQGEMCLIIRCMDGSHLTLDPALVAEAIESPTEPDYVETILVEALGGRPRPGQAEAAEVGDGCDGGRDQAAAGDMEGASDDGACDGGAASPPQLRRGFVAADPEVTAILKAATAEPCRAPSSLELLRSWLGLDDCVRLDAAVEEALVRLLRSERTFGVPPALQPHLRPYQAAGFQWLATNASAGLGCILADDMGLGKTLQTIALISHLREASTLRRPCLVVAPLSLLGSWSAELQRWAPELRRHIYHKPWRRLPANCRREGSQGGAEEVGDKDAGTADESTAAPSELGAEDPPPSPSMAAPDDRCIDEADVVLTTYAVMQRDADSLIKSGAKFDAMILDEAQVIKNARSQTSRAIRRLAHEAAGSVRVALTGTPVENRLSELHAIFCFAMPGFLGSPRMFDEQFARPLQKAAAEGCGKREEVRQKLLAALRPFVLRRSKGDPDIAAELPPKVELLHVVELTTAQRRLYTQVRDATSSEATRVVAQEAAPIADEEALVQGDDIDCLSPEASRLMSPEAALPAPPLWALENDGGAAGEENAPSAKRRRLLQGERVQDAAVDGGDIDGGDAEGPLGGGQAGGPQNRRRLNMLSMLHGLQQACNHPAVVGPRHWPTRLDREDACFSRAVENSGKMARLMELVEEILDEPREKVLIFTQYLRALELLVRTIAAAHPSISVAALHGGLRPDEREQAVRSFQEDPDCCVFVCTLGTGGVGLTLTEAAHVVHFDRCWNPAKEAQATDRAHRIGQRKTVMVHRLVCKGTFEERLHDIVQRKAVLAQEVLPIATGDIVSSILQYNDRELRDLFALD